MKHFNKTKFGSLVKHRQEQLNVTNEQLMQKCRIAKSTMTKVRAGTGSISAELLLNLAESLVIPIHLIRTTCLED